MSSLALEILGTDALRWEPARPLHRNAPANGEAILRIAPTYLNDRAHSIFAGSTEIQLSLIARALLGL